MCSKEVFPCALQDGGDSGHRMSLRMARTAGPAHRRSLELPSQPKRAPAPQPATHVAAPPDVEPADARSEQAPGAVAPPDLLRIDADAQREAAGIGPPAVVPAEVPAEQAPADITAPDTAPAGTPADKGVGLAVSGPPDIVPAIVPDQQPTAGMASQDEVRALPAVQRALPLAPEKYVPVPWSTLGFVKFTVAKASVDGSKASGRIGARRWTVPDIAHMHA
jgi:hypothetical protein